MRRRRPGFLLLLTALLCSPILAPVSDARAQTAPPEIASELLLAPVFPDAVRIEGVQSYRGISFYTRASIEEVVSFYEARLGISPQEEEDTEARSYDPFELRRLSFTLEDDFPRWTGLMAGDRTRAGVWITTRMPRALEYANSSSAIQALLSEMRLQAAAWDEISDEEAQRVIDRYDYLATAYYQPTEERLGGMPLNTGEVIAQACAPQEFEQDFDAYMANLDEYTGLINRSMELQMEGNHEEAEAIMSEAQLMVYRAAANPVGHWSKMVQCLEDIEASAYRTSILIDAHPSNWIYVEEVKG